MLGIMMTVYIWRLWVLGAIFYKWILQMEAGAYRSNFQMGVGNRGHIQDINDPWG